MKFGKCLLCNVIGNLTRDHIVPKLFGGGDGLNIRYICCKCNSSRNHRIGLDEWARMDERQRTMFWGWLKGVLKRRLNREGYVKACPEGAEKDRELLKRIHHYKFSKLLPLIESGNIPGFK